MGYVLGLDLGQAQDYSSLAGLQAVPRGPGLLPDYEGGLLHRWPLGTPYPAIVADVTRWLGTPRLKAAPLVLDRTGIGRAVADLFKPLEARRVPVTITGGTKAIRDEDTGAWSVPKKDLVGTVQVLLQAGRLRIAPALPEAATLERELLAFRVKVTIHANETFESWRERDHDDLVLALALAAWYSELLAGRRPFTAAAGGSRGPSAPVGRVPYPLNRDRPIEDPRNPWGGR
jgi:hypothetical protein